MSAGPEEDLFNCADIGIQFERDWGNSGLAIDKRNPASLALWPHQRKAVQTCEAYFATGSSKGCLVHMPTGTGKTGVMAVLATRRAKEKPVLVVCPSAALVAQLRLEFGSKFWEKLGAPDIWRPDHVLQALPASVDALSEQLRRAAGKRVIVVATIQAVQQIYAAGEVHKLHDFIGTIPFDEGHREPAPSWAKVIRSFAVPTFRLPDTHVLDLVRTAGGEILVSDSAPVHLLLTHNGLFARRFALSPPADGSMGRPQRGARHGNTLENVPRTDPLSRLGPEYHPDHTSGSDFDLL
jgi:putative intracellular protease/amidase